jgi:hypothetical protein
MVKAVLFIVVLTCCVSFKVLVDIIFDEEMVVEFSYVISECVKTSETKCNYFSSYYLISEKNGYQFLKGGQQCLLYWSNSFVEEILHSNSQKVGGRVDFFY